MQQYDQKDHDPKIPFVRVIIQTPRVVMWPIHGSVVPFLLFLK
jgi:hypothetical protein